uniref:porin n=1 Tax=Escherichia coli TaxID=562 RepID=UPI0023B1B96E
VFVWKQNYILVDEYFFFCCTWIVNSAGKNLGGGYDDEDILKYVDVGATYYFNKNMSTYVDYKINLLDDNQFTRDAGINTDNIVALGLVYQF